MSVATLMNFQDPSFNFDHYNDHVNMLYAEGVQAGSLNFSGLPYWIDPAYGDITVPTGWGNTLHTQAHADFISLFPAPYGGSGVANLNDVALNPETAAWWQFSNFQLHYIANQIP